MITQSFLYNAIFFTYGLVLEFFFTSVPPIPRTTSSRSRRATCSRSPSGGCSIRWAPEDDLRHLHHRRYPLAITAELFRQAS